MAVKIKGEYTGNTRVKAIHQEGEQIITCAPLDNRGDGSRFSPTDLLTTSLGSCVLTIMAFVAEDNGINFEGVTYTAEKIMKKSPRMVEKVILKIFMPHGLSEEMKKKLKKAADTCPVRRSLHPDIIYDLEFVYPE